MKVASDSNFQLQVGLEFIGTWGLRRTRRHEFIHTIEGVRCLAAAANIESHVGMKLDAYHWWTNGGLLEDIVKLRPDEIMYVELNDALPGFSITECPELSRELPGQTGVINSVGLLATLRHLGYDGPVVAEPFNRHLQTLPASSAVEAVSSALDSVFAASKHYKLPQSLIGTHPYKNEIPLTKQRLAILR